MDTLATRIFEYATIQKIEKSFYSIDLKRLVATVI